MQFCYKATVKSIFSVTVLRYESDKLSYQSVSKLLNFLRWSF